jgi:hypothetical protein
MENNRERQSMAIKGSLDGIDMDKEMVLISN